MEVSAQGSGQVWGRWPEQHAHQPIYTMDISGPVQPYHFRAPSSFTRAIIAPPYVPVHPFSGAPSTSTVVTHPKMHQNQFSFTPYTSAGQNGIIPAFENNCIQQRSLPRLTQSDIDRTRGMLSRNTRQDFVEELPSASLTIKSERQWNGPGNSPSFLSANTKIVSTTSLINRSSEVNFGTGVDTLMKAIQAKSKGTTTSSVDQSRPVEEASSTKGGKKRYQCTIENCTKVFYQKTHLDIHERAHTGVKPYPCKEPGCGRSFSQLGNLKTHERRHTGERPFHCEICGKRFAQRGNVRAHKIVHDQSKPYLCRLDNCGKQFTQLGNLKSHQNKFHIATIRALTSKFASIKDGDIVRASDKELWEYFANLYKNSNKGIKGRGKDRKVGFNNAPALNSGMKNLGVGGRRGGYSMADAGRWDMIVGVGAGAVGAHGAERGESGQYEMFDVGASSVGTCDDDAPLAFGERMY